MSVFLWIASALSILVATTVAAHRKVGLRFAVFSAVIVGLTPLGFVAGPSIPLFLPEILLAVLMVVVLALVWPNLPAVRIPTFLLVFAMYFIAQVMRSFYFADVSLLELVRDMRPLLFVGAALFLCATTNQFILRRRVSERHVELLIMVCVAADLFYYAAAHAGFISAGGISGAFFDRTGVIRYTDLMTMSLFGIANYFVFYSRNRRGSWVSLLLAGVIAAISFNRIYWIGFLIAFSWWLSDRIRMWSGSNALSYAAGAAPLVLLAAAGVAIVRTQPEAGEVLSRALELFDPGLLIASLKYRFVDPAIIGGYQLSPATLLFGEGMGLKFYIPWFEYRGLDPWHFSVDSLFAFALFKYGVVGVLLLTLAIARMLWGKPWALSNAWIWLYLVVHSGVNVPGFLFFMLILILFRKTIWLLSNDRYSIRLPEQVNEVLH